MGSMLPYIAAPWIRHGYMEIGGLNHPKSRRTFRTCDHFSRDLGWSEDGLKWAYFF